MYQVKNATEETSNEIADLHKRIESLSCELRCLLEELSDMMFKEDIELSNCYPLVEEPTEYKEYDDIQDWANQVSEIESFFEDQE